MSRLPLIALMLSFAAACGEDGESSLTNLVDEPAGANCANGGVKIETGIDADDDGTLSSGEVDQTKYVCNGGGVSTLSSVSDEPAGANCPQGGVKIETGLDSNANGTLETAEVKDTDYVCGAHTEIVKQFSTATVNANTGAPVTILSATIDAPSAGSLFAIGSVDTFCTAAQCPPTDVPHPDGYFWLSTVNNLGVPATEFDYFYIVPDTTESLTRSLTTDIAQAGQTTIYMRGQDLHGDFTFNRPALTLVFFP